MRKINLKNRLLTGVLLVAGMLINNIAFADGCSDSNAPCYADNDDILAGTTTLLPVDDLYVTLPLRANDGKYEVRRYYLRTAGLAVDKNNLTDNTANCKPSFQQRMQSLTGRLFATSNDMLINIRMDTGCDNFKLQVIDELDSNNGSSLTLYAGSADEEIKYAGMAVGDFNRDGYDDIFTMIDGDMKAFTAKCTGDNFVDCTESPSAGLTAGPASSLGDNSGPYAGAPVTGDFDGDGIVDVATPVFSTSDDIYIEIVSICPAAGVVIPGDGTCSKALEIRNFRIIDLNAKLALTDRNLSRPTVDIGAGNFDGLIDSVTGIADDELVVALSDKNNESAVVTVYDYDANSKTMVSKGSTPSFNMEHNGDNAAQLFIEGAQLDADSLQYQAVFSYTEPKVSGVDHKGVVVVISFDNTLGMTVKSTVLANNQKTRITGMAVGRFDPPNVGGNFDFNHQIALLMSNNGSNTQIQFFKALSATTFTPSEVTASRINIQDYDLYIENSMPLAALTAGDLQGRSVVLGTPDIITVATTQVDIVVGLPPMHADFIEPVGGGEPAVLNVSIFPETFNAGFDFDTESATTSSHEGTSGMSGAFKESIAFKNKYGTSTNGVTKTIKLSADQELERTVTKSRDSYTSESYSIAADTLFDDLIVGTIMQMNIYSYPVIGEYVCPDDDQSCDLTCEYNTNGCNKLPLMVQYSGPDNITFISPAKAGGMEFYQPVTEPGNIFSYPGSLALLKINEDMNGAGSDIDLLTSPNLVWDSQSPEAVEVQWANSGGRSKSVDISKEYSFGIAGSIKGSTGVKNSSVTSAELKLSMEGSLSFTNLNTVGHEWSETTGVTLERGLGPSGEDSDSNLLYQGATFIYGLNATDGTFAPAFGAPTSDDHISTYGPFRVGHVANILSTGLPASGNWWKQAYTAAPDIGFNHPQRWIQQLPEGSVPQQIKFNCPVGFDSDLEEPEEDPGSCVPNEDEPTTRNVADAEFYKMKGLFVTAGDSATGPVSSFVTLGDEVKLQARVYNYSLKNMPSGSTTRVRFYAQPWDSSVGEFESGSGKYGFADAVFIGEDVEASQIPAYCGGSQGFDSCATETTPNYVMASVQWDTSALSPQPVTDTDWVFWVVAWVEDSAGNLLEEIDSHGLTAIPDLNIASLAEMPIETYSNNIGYYNQKFSILLPASNSPGVLEPDADSMDLAIEAFEVEPELLKKYTRSTVRVHHRATGDDYEGVSVLLYEGSSDDGQLLDVDLIPHMRADEANVVAFPYIPETCGAHTLFVKTVHNNGGTSPSATVSFEVPCEPSQVTHFIGNSKAKGSGVINLKGQFELRRANSLPGIDLATVDGEVTIHNLLTELDGNGELVDNVPLVLLASTTNSDDKAVYESLSGTDPVVTLKVRKLKSLGAYSFQLKVKQASISDADGCPTTNLLTNFTIEDGGTMPVHVVADAEWACVGKSDVMKTAKGKP